MPGPAYQAITDIVHVQEGERENLANILEGYIRHQVGPLMVLSVVLKDG